MATEFIKLNGYQAQERRRETTFQSCGVTIEEIRSHLFDTIPGLREHVVQQISASLQYNYAANFAAHQKRLDNNLLRSGLEMKDTPADGNCLFASIATELNINEQGVHKFSSSSVRDAVCNFLVDNADEYMQYFEEKQQRKKKEEFQQQVNELRTPGVCKSQLMDLVLYALSGLHNRTIILYTSLAAMPIFILQSCDSSCLDAEVLPLAYNACLGHEHCTPVQAVTDTKNEITLGEYEESLLHNNEQNDQAGI